MRTADLSSTNASAVFEFSFLDASVVLLEVVVFVYLRLGGGADQSHRHHYHILKHLLL